MAISLKEQLKQALQLTEIIYHAPKFNTAYYKRAYHDEHSAGRASGKRLFYDFYAMEFLWSFLGSGQIPKSERERLAALPLDDPRRDYVGKSHRFLPGRAADTIDSVYRQVTLAIADGLIGYVRAAVIQEFQYLTQYSHDWTQFRQHIVKHYNSHGTVSKDDFDRLVRVYLPNMTDHKDVVKKLLKFSKHFSEMHTVNDSDPYDVTRKVSGPSTKEPIKEPEFDSPESTSDEIPDDTDYDTEVPGREFGKYGGKDQPQAPYHQNWSGHSSFKDVGDLPKIPDDDETDEPHPLTEEMINIEKMKDVYKAMLKSGLTLEDLLLGYNNIRWGGSFGGKRWGAGVAALIKLIAARKALDYDAMNGIIDHIYDLQHNTGSLLNKGPMYVSNEDLNRRYKITDVARFIPFVSPMIKQLILRYQPFLRTDPKIAEKEANMENLLKSPKIEFTQDEKMGLANLGMTQTGQMSFRVGINFHNKQGELIDGVFYEISKHVDKTSEGTPTSDIPEGNGKIQYVVSDNYKADVKVFDTFDEAVGYLNNHKRDFNTAYVSNPSAASYTPDEQTVYISSHTKIQLDADKEQILLNHNMGWRAKANSRYYKAYMKDGDRFRLFAFSDGTFLAGYQAKNNYFKTFVDWNSALKYVEEQTVNANEYPDKEEAQTQINAKKSGVPAAQQPLSQVGNYHLKKDQAEALKTFFSSNLFPHTPANNFTVKPKPNGMWSVIKKVYHVEKEMFSVGHNGNAFGKPYKLVKPYGSEKLFDAWEPLLSYIKNNISELTGYQPKEPLSTAPNVAISSGDLPPNATSPAMYTAHVGISKSPTTTIRLTKEDEQKLENIGFVPKLVGDNVWYLHNGTHDTVKFYPNNVAKVFFASMPNAGITNSIEKVLKWLPTKYSNQITASPIKTGATVQPAAAPVVPTASTKGIQPGIMFAKDIQEAGFTWDSMGEEYIDYLNGPGSEHNILKIAPDRSSVLTFVDGTKLSFPNLAALVTYLKSKYPDAKSEKLKKKSDVVSEWPLAPGSLTDALKAGKFNYVGPTHKDTNASTTGFVFDNSEHDRVIFFNDGSSLVFINSSTKSKEDLTFSNAEQLIDWLNQSFPTPIGGSGGILTAPKDLKFVPEWVDAPMINLLEKGQFKYVGPVYGANETNLSYENGKGDELVLHRLSSVAEVRDSLNPNHVETYSNVEEFREWLNEKFGSANNSTKTNRELHDEIEELLGGIHYLVNNKTYETDPKHKIEAIKKLRDYVWENDHTTAGLSNTKWAVEHLNLFLPYVKANGIPPMFAGVDDTAAIVTQWKINQKQGISNIQEPKAGELKAGEPKAGDPNSLSDDEVNAISNIVKQHPGFTVKKEFYLEEATGKIDDKFHVMIYKEKMPVFAITKENGKFVLWESADGWSTGSIGKFSTFKELVPTLKTALQNYASNEPYLTDQQVEWIETYVQGKNPHIKLVWSAVSSTLRATYADSNETLFDISKTPSTSYFIRYFLYDTEEGNVKWSHQTYGSFDSFAKALQSNFDTYTQLIPHLMNLLDVSINNLVDKITNIGFKFIGGGDVNGNDIDIFQHTNGNEIIIGKLGFCQYNLPDGTSYKFHTYKGLSDYLDTLNYGKSPQFSPAENEEFRLKGKGQFLPNEHLQDLAAENGFTAMNNSKVKDSILYSNQAGDFYFEVFENGIRWTTSHGSREHKLMPHEQFDFFHNVFEKMDENMTSEDLDYLFTKNTFTPEEKTFDRLLRKAKLNDGISLIGTQLHSKISNNGLEWDESDKVYMNEELKQILSVSPSNISSEKYIFRIYWVGKDAKGFSTQIGNIDKMLAAIGPAGAIQMNVPASIRLPKTSLQPSGETYKTTNNEANADLIKLNDQDESILKYYGFNFVPKENRYYRNAEGDILRFYNTGKAEASINGEHSGFSTINNALQYLLKGYYDQDKKVHGGNTNLNMVYPFSGTDYNAKPKDDDITPIRLIAEDENIIQHIGFVWVPDQKQYVKKINENETPALQEAGKKKSSKKKKSPQHVAQQFNLDLDMDERCEVIVPYNTGNAMWADTKYPESSQKWEDQNPEKFKEGTILDILQFVWHRWSKVPQNKNLKDTAPTDDLSEELYKLGFEWKEQSNPDVYEYRKYKHEDDKTILHKVQVYSSGMMNYTRWEQPKSTMLWTTTFKGDYQIPSGLEMLKHTFYIQHLQTPGATNYNTMTQDGVQKPVHLEKVDADYIAQYGFHLDSSVAYPTYTNGEQSFTVYNDGTATYKNNNSQHHFSDVKSGMKFLKGLSPLQVSAHRVKPFKEVEENMNQLGFYWDDSTVKFVKNDSYELISVIFMSNGMIYYHEGGQTQKDAEFDNLTNLYLYLKVLNGGKQS